MATKEPRTRRECQEYFLEHACTLVQQLTVTLAAQQTHLQAEPAMPVQPRMMTLDELDAYTAERHKVYAWKSEQTRFETEVGGLRRKEQDCINALHSYGMPDESWILHQGKAIGITVRDAGQPQATRRLVVYPASGVLPSLTNQQGD